MKALVHKQKSLAIAYDASRMSKPAAECFNADFWNSRQAIVGKAKGRGSAWYIDAPFGPVVLRQFLRGGWAAKLSRKHYFYTSVEHSRPFREFRLLVKLFELGLPVPRPVAALCEHSGLVSTGAILTARIPHARSLAGCLADTHTVLETRHWQDVGRCIRGFHDAGVWHADLNAGNILLDSDQQVFLIDFDRAVYRPRIPVSGNANLDRLKRSLKKTCMARELPWVESEWSRLLEAYHG